MDFFKERIIITENDDDFVLCSDIYYFINQNKPYKDFTSYRKLHKIYLDLKLDYKNIHKKKFYNSVNITGMKWKPTIKI